MSATLSRTIENKQNDLDLFKLLKDSIGDYNKRNKKENRIYTVPLYRGSNLFKIGFKHTLDKRKFNCINKYLHEISFTKDPQDLQLLDEMTGLIHISWRCEFKRFLYCTNDNYHILCAGGLTKAFSGDPIDTINHVVNEFEDRYKIPYEHLIETLDNV